MGFDGVFGQEKRGGNLAIGIAPGHQFQNLALASGDIAGERRPSWFQGIDLFLDAGWNVGVT